MSCYVRHLDEVLEGLGLENTKENRKLLDQKIRKVLNMEDAHCPEIWQRIKPKIQNEKELNELTQNLKEL